MAMKVRIGIAVAFINVFSAWPAAATAGDAKADPSPASVYEPTRIWMVHLVIPAKEYEAMQPVTRGPFSWFSASKKPDEPKRQVHTNTFNTDLAFARGEVTVDGRTFAGVGVRYKGNGTISDAARTAKKSIKIDLDHFGGEDRFRGSKTINLHCGVTDPSK